MKEKSPSEISSGRRDFLKLAALAPISIWFPYLSNGKTSTSMSTPASLDAPSATFLPFVSSQESEPWQEDVATLNRESLKFISQLDMPIPKKTTHESFASIPQWIGVFNGDLKILEFLTKDWQKFKQENAVPATSSPFRQNVDEYLSAYYPVDRDGPSGAMTEYGITNKGLFLIVVTYFGTGTIAERYAQAINESYHRYFGLLPEGPERTIFEEAGSNILEYYVLARSGEGDPATAMLISPEEIKNINRLRDTGWYIAVSPGPAKRFFLNHLQALMLDTRDSQFFDLREHFGALIASRAIEMAEKDGSIDQLIKSLFAFAIHSKDESFLIKPSNSYFAAAIEDLRSTGHLLQENEIEESYKIHQIAYVTGNNLQEEHGGFVGPRLYVLNAYRNEGEVIMVPHPDGADALTNINFYAPGATTPLLTNIQYNSKLRATGDIRQFILNMPGIVIPDGSRLEFDTTVTHFDEKYRRLLYAKEHQVAYINATLDRQIR